MIVIDQVAELSGIEGDTHIALGVFDGVHIGHRAVIAQAVEAAKRDGGKVGVITFEPHPIRVLAPDRAPRRILASIGHKVELLESLGVDFLCVVEFTIDFAQIEAEDFISQLVKASAGLKTIAVGEDWIFGRNRGGNIHKLKEWGGKYSFDVMAAQPVRFDGERVSSTRIRQAVRDGNLQAIESMLGRPYDVVGTVIEGKQLARQLGFPTANMVVHNEQLPPDGVWSLKVNRHGQTYTAIGNLGRRPTVEHEGARRLLEVHLFDFEGDLYGEILEVEFVAFVRKEQQFDSVEELKAQIDRDVAAVRGLN